MIKVRKWHKGKCAFSLPIPTMSLHSHRICVCNKERKKRKKGKVKEEIEKRYPVPFYSKYQTHIHAHTHTHLHIFCRCWTICYSDNFKLFSFTIVFNHPPATQLYIILIRPERNVRQSMMPVRYSAMNKTAGTGPSSMMAAIMVTAATCNQNEKIEKQASIFTPDDSTKLKVPTTGK